MLRKKDIPVWEAAREFLDVRSNDEHTLFSYYWAKQLLKFYPEADADVVLPAILFHDVGWKNIPIEKVLKSFGPKMKYPELRRQHEVEGVVIATQKLLELGYNDHFIDPIRKIIDGHDTTKKARSLNDSIVKDSDKLWRFTRHGNETIQSWFDISMSEVHEILRKQLPGLLTDQGKLWATQMLEVAELKENLTKYIPHVSLER